MRRLQRLVTSTAAWETIARLPLGPKSANMQKLGEEGSWGTENIILGFQVNTDQLSIQLPEEYGARVLLNATLTTVAGISWSNRQFFRGGNRLNSQSGRSGAGKCAINRGGGSELLAASSYLHLRKGWVWPYFHPARGQFACFPLDR